MGATARNFFSDKEKNEIMLAIVKAELDCSGEIRVHIDTNCKDDVLNRAASVFEKLGMINTRERNGVLFYLAVKPHKFAIIGDVGINARVDQDFWDKIKERMLVHFKQGAFAKGITEAIDDTGKELKKHFPWQKDDVNELPNEISYGE